MLVSQTVHIFVLKLDSIAFHRTPVSHFLQERCLSAFINLKERIPRQPHIILLLDMRCCRGYSTPSWSPDPKRIFLTFHAGLFDST